MVNTNPAELAWITKNKRLLLLLQNEMIMPPWMEAGCLQPQASAHAEVEADPVLSGKNEKHLFAACFRAEEFLPDEPALKQARIDTPENTFVAVQLHRDHPSPDPGIPSFAKKFHLGELGHAGD